MAYEIPKTVLGRTGLTVTRLGTGGAYCESPDGYRRALDCGVNYMDTARAYRDGEDEKVIGEAIQGRRHKLIIATKTQKRDADGARRDLEASLRSLGTDYIDIYQIHHLNTQPERDQALGPGGAIETVQKAQEEGLVRFIGVTGHGVTVAAMHKRSLERFAFDSVLLPYNFTMMQNAQYADDFVELEALCVERGVAMQTIKGITMKPWGEREHTHGTWYEPFSEQADIDRAVHWVLGRPGAFLNTAADIELLPRVLDAASRYETAPADAEMRELVAKREMAPLFV